jgi:hypothetical protein
MGVAAITSDAAATAAVQTLGLDPESVDITGPEALTASLRRAASFLSPTTPGALVRAVDDALASLAGYTDETRPALESMLDAMLSCGDLLELIVEGERRQRHLFLGPPAFVRRASGASLLLGIRPDGTPLLGDDLMGYVEYEGHIRLLPADHDLTDRLAHEGLTALRATQWLRAPRPEPASVHLAAYAARLDALDDAGVIEGVRLIDPATRPTFYQGRWRDPKQSDQGLFVGRRPQEYGAPLWCVVDVVGGEVRRGVDLPVDFGITPGADDAWRLQAAMDRLNGTPQRFALRPAPQVGTTVLDLFSPLPSWAQRRLDVVGMPIMRSRGALFSYALADAEVSEEVAFLEEMVWMAERSSDGDP